MANTAAAHHHSAEPSWNGGVSPMNVSYGKLMMWFFLLSDAFTFSGLLITYGLVRSANPAYDPASGPFQFSTEYWPIPEKVFEAVPFFPRCTSSPRFRGFDDLYFDYEFRDHGFGCGSWSSHGPKGS